MASGSWTEETLLGKKSSENKEEQSNVSSSLNGLGESIISFKHSLSTSGETLILKGMGSVKSESFTPKRTFVESGFEDQLI